MRETIVSEVVERIEELRAQKGCGLVAIDGRCGAGRNSLASAVREHMRWPVLHMEDFALRAEELAQGGAETGPGGSMAYERLVREVLEPLTRRETICFVPCNRSAEKQRGAITVGPAPFILLEGAYCLHPKLRQYFDLKIFLDVNPDEQLQRLEERATPEQFAHLRDEVIPDEERYIREYDVRGAADMYFLT